MGNKDLELIVREYLTYVAGDNEFVKRSILDAMRDKSISAIKDDARHTFPSLFPRNRKAKPLDIPEEIQDEDVKYNPELIEELKDRARMVKKELSMNENVVSESAEVSSNERVTVNFYIPPGMDVDNLTLDNYRSVTGKRYRMTKEQKARNLTREQAFEESRALAVSQLGDDNE